MFTMKVQGLDRLQALFKKLPVEMRKELSAELENTGREIRDAAKKDAPADERRLAQSISSKKTGSLNVEVVAQTAYAGYLEFGTKSKTVVPTGLESVANGLKGKGDGSGNPLEAIEKWVTRKGLAGIYSTKTRKLSRSKKSIANIKQTAYLIWRHIKKYGIKPQPYFFKQVVPAQKKLNERVANVIKRFL